MLGLVARLLVLTLVLNVVRYVVGAPLEGWLIIPGMFGAMAERPGVFNVDFTTGEWVTSYLYNFAMWGSVVLLFHMARPALTGGTVTRSFKVFGAALALYLALSAVLMNHHEARAFWYWHLLDGVLVFPIVALANGLLYPRIVSSSRPTAGSPAP